MERKRGNLIEQRLNMCAIGGLIHYIDVILFVFQCVSELAPNFSNQKIKQKNNNDIFFNKIKTNHISQNNTRIQIQQLARPRQNQFPVRRFTASSISTVKKFCFDLI